MKVSTRKILFEFLSIVIAVVLAMGLSEWRQEVLNHRQAEKSYQNVLQEIANNYRNLKPDSAAIAELIKNIDTWFEQGDEYQDSVGDRDYELNLLSKSAWEVAKLNGSMTYIENGRLQNMSLIYEFHDFYMDAGRQVFDALAETAKLEEEDPKYAMEMRGVRMKLGLTYNAMVGYLSAVRDVVELENAANSSD